MSWIGEVVVLAGARYHVGHGVSEFCFSLATCIAPMIYIPRCPTARGKSLPSVRYHYRYKTAIFLACRVSSSRNALILRDVQSCQQYLEYCKSNDTNLQSSVFRGTMYELAVKHVLESQLNCQNLTRSGGTGDYGIDLFGQWDLSQYQRAGKAAAGALAAKSDIDLASDVSVLVQCKNHSGKIGATVVRELGGIYDYHVKTRTARRTTFMFLVSPEPLTPLAHAQLNTSSIPMAHIRMLAMQPDAQDVFDLASWSGAKVGPVYLNSKLRRLLQGLDIEKHLIRRQL